jgi:hypothetical protein
LLWLKVAHSLNLFFEINLLSHPSGIAIPAFWREMTYSSDTLLNS